MSKRMRNEPPKSESEAFEMIELAVNDLDILARAFDVISQVLDEHQKESVTVDQKFHADIPEWWLN